MADMRLLAASRSDWTGGRFVDGELAPDRVSRFCERKRCCRTGETRGDPGPLGRLMSASVFCKRQTSDQSTTKSPAEGPNEVLGDMQAAPVPVIKGQQPPSCHGWQPDLVFPAALQEQGWHSDVTVMEGGSGAWGGGVRVWGQLGVGKGKGVRPEPPRRVCVSVSTVEGLDVGVRSNT